MVQASWQGAAGGLSSGTFSDDFYVTSTANVPGVYGEIRLGTGAQNASAQIGVWLEIHNGYLRLDNATGGQAYMLDNVLTNNAKHTLIIRFDAAAGTFTGSLDGPGHPLTADSGATTVFPFSNPLSGIDSVSLYAGFARDQIFHDNVVLQAVPEPATMSLLGLGALGLMWKRRR